MTIEKPCDANVTLRRWPSRAARRVATTLVNLTFPPRCPACGGPIAAATSDTCLDCYERTLPQRLATYCPTCLSDVGPHEVVDYRCRICRDQRVRTSGAVRAGVYRERLGELVRAYKFQRRHQMESVFGRWLTQAIASAEWLTRIEALLPVPTHWSHRIRRYLYPAERLAAIAAKQLTLPNVPVLRRVRGGPHQIGLSYSARQTNVRGKFALARGVRLQGARLLLIDDVLTTGATVDECAKVLLRNGAAEIYVAVLVKVPWNAVQRGPIPHI